MEFYNSDFFRERASKILWNKVLFCEIFTGKPMHFPIAVTNRLCPNRRDGFLPRKLAADYALTLQYCRVRALNPHKYLKMYALPSVASCGVILSKILHTLLVIRNVRGRDREKILDITLILLYCW